MTLEERMKGGFLYYEYGNVNQEDKAYEKVIEKQRRDCKEAMYDFNSLRPSRLEEQRAVLARLLGHMGKEIWIEPPCHMAYGCHTHIGDYFYANFNLVIVDDADVYIGNHVMCAPNVTITATGHPVDAQLRRPGTQFSVPVHIEDDVWIGSNVVILPGVRVGEGSVIGAGSVVTKDIPPHVVAVGHPCRVLRPITPEDKERYYKDRTVDPDFRLPV